MEDFYRILVTKADSLKLLYKGYRTNIIGSYLYLNGLYHAEITSITTGDSTMYGVVFYIYDSNNLCSSLGITVMGISHLGVRSLNTPVMLVAHKEDIPSCVLGSLLPWPHINEVDR